MTPIIDRTIVALIISPFVSYLISKGYFAPEHKDYIVQYIDQIWAIILMTVTVIGFFNHHTQVKTQQMILDNQNKQTPAPAGTPADTLPSS